MGLNASMAPTQIYQNKVQEGRIINKRTFQFRWRVIFTTPEFHQIHTVIEYSCIDVRELDVVGQPCSRNPKMIAKK